MNVQVNEQLTQDIADTPASNPVLRFFKAHPKGFWFFFWGEFAERCSYYGMRAILAKYMADALGLGQENAATYMSFFIAACYFLPLLGGWIADNFLGKYWTIVGFSLPYILGHVILGIENIPCLVIALSLLAMGSGVIKPNISTLMGLTYDQQRPGDTKLRSDAFATFYFAINIGAALSQFAMPPIRDAAGYFYAFLFPAGLMVLAFIIFALGKKYYGVQVIERKERTAEERAEQRKILGRIMGLFVLVMFFWAIFDQAASTWIFFADACMSDHLLGFKMNAEQVQSFNAVFILIFLPLVTILLKRLIDKGYRIRATDKMLVGFVLTATCMGIMALAALLAGTADLRPALAEGVKEATPLSVVIAGKGEPITIQKPMKVMVDGPDTVKITLAKEKLPDSNPEVIVQEAYAITGKGVLKLVATKTDAKGEPTALAVEGEIAKVEQTIKRSDQEDPTRKTLVEGAATVGISGEMNVSERWFVAPDKQVTIGWQVFAYLVITIAEILISVTGLELAYAAAPKSMTGFVTGCWLVTVGMANLLINAPITRLYTRMQPSAYFGMLGVTLLVVSVGFVFVAKRFNAQEAAQTATPA